jgi:hypothetical protein
MRRTFASATLVLLALCSLAAVVRAQTATPLTLGAALQDSIAPAGTNYYSVTSALPASSQVLLTALAGYPTRTRLRVSIFDSRFIFTINQKCTLSIVVALP